MGLLLLTIQILIMKVPHSEVQVSSTMENYTMLLLVASKEIIGQFHSPRCTRGVQQMPATSSIQMGIEIT
jgi:hypothetical protein